MNFIKRELLFCCLLFGPFILGAVLLAVVGFAALKLTPEEPGYTKIVAAVRQHFASHQKSPLCVFDGNVYLSRSAIQKGAIVQATSVDKADFPDDKPIKGVTFTDDEVVGRIAQKTIKSGQLLQAGDVGGEVVSVQKVAPAPASAAANFWLPTIFLGALLLAGVVGSGVSYFWLMSLAFKQGIWRGIRFILLGFVGPARFVANNWNESRRPFQIMLVAVCLFGICSGLCSQAKVHEQELSFICQQEDLEKAMSARSQIVYATKHLAAGKTITADEVGVKLLEQSRIPQNPLTKSASAIGHKAKYDVEPGQILSVYDIAASSHSSKP